jgi:predicted dehydrogenase
MARVRAAIIGTGGIAQAHVVALQAAAERVELVAAMDVDRSRVEDFCAAHRIPRADTDLERLLTEARPDLVHICTPPALHAELAVRCLEGGSWVLCEKPLCASLAELDRIAAAERATGRYCAAVFQWRFGSGARHLRRLIASGALGRPLVGLCQTTWYRDPAYYGAPWRGTWTSELGGATTTQGIHALDLFLWLLGDWREVRASMATLDREIEVEDVSMAMVRFENGAMGSIVNSVLSPRQETALRWDFQRATVELTGLYGYANRDWRYSMPDGATHRDELARWRALPPEDVPSSHAAQVAALLDDLERGERPLTSGAEARRTVEFVASLYKSAITDRPVGRGSIGRGDPFYHGIAAALRATPAVAP